MKKIYALFLSAALCLLFFACKKEPDFEYYYYTPEEYRVLTQYLTLEENPFSYTITFPKHLQKNGSSPRQVERDKVVLGRVLFYDKHLSKDGKISCGSCHRQSIGFSDDLPISRGVFNRAGTRNAMALASVASFSTYYGTDLNGISAGRFFWDNRASTAAAQNRSSMINPMEMDMTMEGIVQAVENQPYYQPLFRNAYYGDRMVTADRINESIAHFINAMGSFRSKFVEEASRATNHMNFTRYDQSFLAFNDLENMGKALYLDHCAICHTRDMGRPEIDFANNGLDPGQDPGVGGISGRESEKGTFKVPMLRNIAVTGPYMHDGRFQTLDQVLEHYSSNIQDLPNLSPWLNNGSTAPGMNLSDLDKQALIAFLNTLTDEKFLKDQRFSDPFR